MAKLVFKYDTATQKRTVGNLSDLHTIITGITLSSGSWSLVSGLYEYTYSNAAILAASIVDVIPSNPTIDYVISAEILPYVYVSAGSIKLYAKNAPTNDITINLVVK